MTKYLTGFSNCLSSPLELSPTKFKSWLTWVLYWHVQENIADVNCSKLNKIIYKKTLIYTKTHFTILATNIILNIEAFFMFLCVRLKRNIIGMKTLAQCAAAFNSFEQKHLNTENSMEQWHMGLLEEPSSADILRGSLQSIVRGTSMWMS